LFTDGIYIDMKEIIRNVLAKYLTESSKSWIEQHCDDAFDTKEARYFCYATTKIFKNNYNLQDEVRKKLSSFVEQNEESLSSIYIEVLKKNSTISKKGFEEFTWVTKNGQQLCPNIREKMIKVYNDLLGGKHVLYVDKDGNYHVINRLDTNYSALAVMFTEYFADRDIPYILNLRNVGKKSDWEKPVEHLINVVLYPSLYKPETYHSSILKELEIDKNALKIMFTDLVKEELPSLEPKAVKVLNRVRMVGFETETKFMNLLDEYGIEYKNFGKDYGFVDRFLGIDIFVKVHNMWVPAQIKTSKQEKTLIDTLGCEGYLEVFQKDGKFFVNNVNFELFFCKMLKICKERENEINSDDIEDDENL